MTYLPISYLMLMQAAASSSAIPYRTDTAVSTGSAITTLLATGVLLALLIGVLLYSRRRGWLPGAARPVTSVEADIRVLASRRISMATHVHVIEYRGQAYLLTESARTSSASLTPLPAPGVHPTREGKDA